MGHELGNHSCFHPCRTRAEWDWKPPYRLEEYSRDRIHDELLLANRILHLIDGRTERSYGATCSDLTCSDGEPFIDDIRDLFTIVRAGLSDKPMTGPAPFVVPAFHADYRRAAETISVLETMQSSPDSWILVGMHGVGTGTHLNFMDAEEHRCLIDWITAQRGWLEAVTVLEAVQQHSVQEGKQLRLG